MNTSTNDISGRLVLITGASGGIGSAIAREFAKQQCSLALTYSSNASAASKLVEELQQVAGEKSQITTHKADLSVPEEISKLCLEVQEAHNRPVDILISNAGYGRRIRDISEIPLDEFDRMLNINLRGPFLLVQGVVSGMKAQKWGRIIFVSSIAAHGGGMNGPHYAASKGGLMGMMKNLSTTLAEHNISVNDVAPAICDVSAMNTMAKYERGSGIVPTSHCEEVYANCIFTCRVGNTGMIPNGDSFPGLVESIPMHRLCETDEVARAVIMYATCGFATGQSLVVAGGLK